VETAAQLKTRVDELQMLLYFAGEFDEAANRIGRHVPCWNHGGTDGLRLFYGNAGELLGVCNTCNDGRVLDVYGLIQWVTGKPFIDVFKDCQEYAGVNYAHGRRTDTAKATHASDLKPATPDAKKRQKIIDTWASGEPIAPGSTQHKYIETRLGREFFFDFDSLRSARLSYWEIVNDEPRCLGVYPGIIAAVRNLAGELVNVHRVYLNQDGHKAVVPSPKKTMSSYLQGNTNGCAVHLIRPGDSTERLHVCEGLETGLAIADTARHPGAIWCALTAGGLERLVLPENTRELIICADRDRSGRGEQAAKKLASRYNNVKTKIVMPSIPIPEGAKGVDWLDGLRGPKR